MFLKYPSKKILPSKKRLIVFSRFIAKNLVFPIWGVVFAAIATEGVLCISMRCRKRPLKITAGILIVFADKFFAYLIGGANAFGFNH